MDETGDTPHNSTAFQNAKPKSEPRWLYYIVGVPIVGVIYHLVYVPLMHWAFAIGETVGATPSPLLGTALAILNFPMMYLWFPIGDWLKPYLTDNGVFSLFAKTNAVVWGFLVTWLVLFVKRRVRSKGL